MKKISKKYIGVFDSGFGGLTILQGIVKALPQYDYMYLGDTARVPYGTRSTDVIYEFTRQAIDFFFQNGCTLVIFACNTASSDALRKIQKDYLPKKYPGKRVLGVLIPAAEEAAAQTVNSRVGVIATEATVTSNAFVREVTKLNPRISVFQSACPLLVPIIEAGEYNSIIVDLMLKKYLRPLTAKKIDTLILGCTHYGIIKLKIKKVVGKKVTIISESQVVPKKLKDYLARHPEIEKTLGKGRKRIFYSTDLTEKFDRLGSIFFGQKIKAKKALLS
ncbi:MAG: glutamate racemase [Candidatus Pacebacteria bacterium]|jgi:glutamate racemase|nr:glutamate racemase [Candidatus Paceibacterota bacterium]